MKISFFVVCNSCLRIQVENEYENEAIFPSCARLLDIMRCSVTFRDISDLLDGYHYFLKKINENSKRLQIARIKNSFSSTKASPAGGYRDIKVNIVYTSSTNTKKKMIGELQLLVLPFLNAKKKSHKLYAILRQQSFYQFVVGNADSNASSAPNSPKSVTSAGSLLTGDTKFEIATSEQRVYKAVINEELNLIALIGDGKFTIVIDIFDLRTGNKIQQLSSGMEMDDTIEFYKFKTSSSKFMKTKNKNNIELLFTESKRRIIYRWKKKDSKIKQLVSIKHEKISSNFMRVVGFVVDNKSDRMLLHLQNSSSRKYNAIQTRSMNNIDKVIGEIEIEESMDVIPISIDPNVPTNACAVSGFYPTFWMLDFVNNKCIKCQSKNLAETHSSSFIGQKYIAIGGVSNKGKNGLIEIWNKNSNNYNNDNNNNDDAQCVRVLDGFVSGVNVIRYFGGILYGCSFKGELIIFDTSNDKYNKQEVETKLYDIPKVHISENGKYLTVAGGGCKVFAIGQ